MEKRQAILYQARTLRASQEHQELFQEAVRRCYYETSSDRALHARPLSEDMPPFRGLRSGAEQPRGGGGWGEYRVLHVLGIVKFTYHLHVSMSVLKVLA